jgi:hypothetical protein
VPENPVYRLVHRFHLPFRDFTDSRVGIPLKPISIPV